MDSSVPVKKLPHHDQMEFCLSRAKYRQGRKLTAVKVYTVNDESKYLIVSGVPAIKILNELKLMCLKYGGIEILELLPEYPHEDFAEVYLLKYCNIKNARFAKKHLDGKSFYGGVLHLCYAPELESVEETREKLQERRKTIAALTRYQQDASCVNALKSKNDHKSASAARYLSKLKPELRTEYISDSQCNISDEQTAAINANNRIVEPVSVVNSVQITESDYDGLYPKSNSTHNSEHTSVIKCTNPKNVTSVVSVADPQASLLRNSETSSCESSKKRFCETKITSACSSKKIKVFGNKNILAYKQ